MEPGSLQIFSKDSRLHHTSASITSWQSQKVFQIVSTICQNQERKEEKRKPPDPSKDNSISYKANNIDGNKIPKNMLDDFIDLLFAPNYENMGSVDLYY